MLTVAQMTAYETVKSNNPDMDWVAPRKVIINMDKMMLLGATQEQFGDGTVLLIGYVDPDMEDCGCGHDHILYAPIRADGMFNIATVSGTVDEIATNPPEFQWDNGVPVKTTDWPIDGIDLSV